MVTQMTSVALSGLVAKLAAIVAKIRFCYSGGFALNAAAGGATRVVAVDSSQPAVDTARRNAARNGLEGLTEFIKDDALNFMKVRLTPMPLLSWCCGVLMSAIIFAIPLLRNRVTPI